MSERLASWDPKDHSARGIPSKELVNVYRRWGEGGFGVILSGNVMFTYEDLEAPGNPIIPRDAEYSGERFERFSQMATEGKKEGSLMIAQVGHAGRQTDARVQPHPVSASDVQLVKGGFASYAKPRAATEKDIEDVINGFAHAAEYLEKAGWDGLQLHGAHGYLLAQFLSQTTNKRTDQYGGSIENRARLIVEVAEEIRRRVKPDFVLGIKLNSVEFQEGGFSPAEARDLCAILEKARFDFVELSGGTYEEIAFVHKNDSTRKREAFFLQFAEIITPALSNTKCYITGGLRSVPAMLNALKVVDGIGLGRPATQEPDICKKILSGESDGARKLLISDDQFALTLGASATQIRQMGQDHEPIDLSQQDQVAALVKDMQSWQAKVAEDPEIREVRPAEIVSAVARPYGAARL